MKEEKNAYRARVRALISHFDNDYIAFSNAGIAAAVLSLAEYRRAERVFAYSAIGRECDTRKIIEDAAEAGKPLALPVVLGGGRMVFAEYRGALNEGTFGIGEPAGYTQTLVPSERDIMIVPALCCDQEGYRLGRGGGYYDRYLAECRAFTVCLCREKLLAEKVPRDWNDLPVLTVITEKRVIRPRVEDR